jgi:O-antigen/teichoic acid export membrane protein
LGVLLTISGLLTLLSTYLIQIYVGKIGGLEEVGFYTAGFTLLNSYVNLFTVMSTDYFPRLSSISDDNVKKVEMKVLFKVKRRTKTHINVTD